MQTLFKLLLLLIPSMAIAKNLAPYEAGIWSIAPDNNMQRWIIIHNLQEARHSGIYHIEVIGRIQGNPVWQIQRIAPHIAITEEALKNSVVAPLNKGAVYPEAYDNAYQNWLKENNGRGGSVCKTTVIECLQTTNKNLH